MGCCALSSCLIENKLMQLPVIKGHPKRQGIWIHTAGYSCRETMEDPSSRHTS